MVLHRPVELARLIGMWERGWIGISDASPLAGLFVYPGRFDLEAFGNPLGSKYFIKGLLLVKGPQREISS